MVTSAAGLRLSEERRLDPVGAVQLGQDVPHVGLDSLDSPAQLAGGRHRMLRRTHGPGRREILLEPARGYSNAEIA